MLEIQIRPLIAALQLQEVTMSELLLKLKGKIQGVVDVVTIIDCAHYFSILLHHGSYMY